MTDADATKTALQWMVPEGEAQPVWDLFARVFRTDRRQPHEPLAGDPPFFVEPHWTLVGLVNGLEGLAFPGEGPDPERDGFYERDELGPLLELMAGEGTEVLYLTETHFQVSGPVQACAASRAGLRACVPALPTGFGIQQCFVFDNTARWGLLVEEDNIAFLGGEPALMDRYLPRVGGLDLLQQRFASRLDEEVIPGSHLYHVTSARVCRLWYAYLRWPWPFPQPPM